jgi:hypothetical protein
VILSVGVEGCERRRDHGSCAVGVLRNAARFLLSRRVEAHRREHHSSAYRVAHIAQERRPLLLLCPYCNTPRRHVYGWEWDSFSGWSNRVRSISWRCRSCARLRYSSEGGYLRPTGLGRLGHLGVKLRAYGNLPRPEPWLPYVFTSIVLRPHAVQLQGWLLIEVRKWGC